MYGPAQSRESSTLSGHTDGVEDITWRPQAPDQMASGGADKTLRLWDVKSMHKLCWAHGRLLDGG